MRFFADRRADVAVPLQVRAFQRPYARYHDTYQRYYAEGLRRYCSTIDAEFRTKVMSRFPRIVRALKRVRDGGYAKRLRIPQLEQVIDAAAHVLEGPLDTPSGYFENLTGQYLALLPNGELRRFSIDARDSHALGSDDLCAWGDVYFKTNYWRGVEYPNNVAPLFNVDPLILPQIEWLRARRNAPKHVDLTFVVRVWGGITDEGEGIEHNLRLLEAVNRARCTKQVLAVIVVGDVPNIRRRLARLGIRSTSRNIKSRELWQLTARSRLNVFRLGLHYCVPWRMTGSLAIGSCVVLDRPPFSVWPAPLHEEINFLSLGTMVGPGVPVAATEEYDEIPERIESWLRHPAHLAEVGRANAEYFDRHLDPARLGAHIIGTVAPGAVAGTVAARTSSD
jgi:hypothetical protein